MQVTKKMPEEIGALARDGAYISGLFLEGATWDSRTSSLEVLNVCTCLSVTCLLSTTPASVFSFYGISNEQTAKGKELVCEMPVILVKAVPISGSDQEQNDLYQCPLYKTRQRGASFIWLVGLRSKVPTSRWVMAGAALIMEAAEA